jgi:ammonium transporter, Amt family
MPGTVALRGELMAAGAAVMTSFAITCLVTVLFACITHVLAFTSSSSYVRGLSRVLLQGIVSDTANNSAIPTP